MGILKNIFKLRSENSKIKTKEIVKMLGKKDKPTSKRMVAIFKRIKGSNRKWIHTECFGANNTKSKPVTIKKKLVVDGKVWDNGQTIEREDK
tara:strand:- start:204 stop:479 length:276 start_codon:yes stop_codon:yes gene_type:complete